MILTGHVYGMFRLSLLLPNVALQQFCNTGTAQKKKDILVHVGEKKVAMVRVLNKRNLTVEIQTDQLL